MKPIANGLKNTLPGSFTKGGFCKQAISSLGGVQMVLWPQTLWDQEAQKVRGWSVPHLTIQGGPLGLNSMATGMCCDGVSGISETSHPLTVACTHRDHFSLPCLQPFRDQKMHQGNGGGRSRGGGDQIGVNVRGRWNLSGTEKKVTWLSRSLKNGYGMVLQYGGGGGLSKGQCPGKKQIENVKGQKTN